MAEKRAGVSGWGNGVGLVALLVVALAGCASDEKTASRPPQGRAAAPEAAPVSGPAALITAEQLAEDVEALSSDALRGRATGTPEAMEAAKLIAEALAEAGVQPAGNAGGYLQTIDVQGFTMSEEPVLVAVGADGAETAAGYGADFSYSRGPPASGDFAVVLARQASEIPDVPRADAALILLTSGRTAQEWLAQAGAPRGAGWGLLLAESSDAAPEGDERLPSGLYSRSTTSLRLRGALLERAKAGELARLRLTMEADVQTPAANVVGLLPGAGTPQHPELAQQAVVFTAHYDHLGVAAASGGEADVIFNGADDDASGVAFVLALARAFAQGPPPARTLVFLLVTGEEVGLLGTTYYLDHPVVPIEDTVANVNFEMVGRPDELAGGPGRLWLTGFERSNLGPAWAAAGLPIGPDLRPEQRFFERSDNIAFVQRGVVAQSLSSFNLHTDYHTVDDEADRLDFVHMQTAARAAYDACRLLAGGTLDPQWIEPAPATR